MPDGEPIPLQLPEVSVTSPPRKQLIPLARSSIVPENPGEGLEATITRLEHELGITSIHDRILEASLFIDNKFLTAEVLMGRAKGVERLFGDEAWVDWLEGHKLAREYGRKPLTPEFMMLLHRSLAKRSAPEFAATLRGYGVLGGDYTNVGQPAVYTEDQVAAIKENPYLSFQVNDKTDGEIKGKITYPTTYGGPKAIRAMLFRMIGQLSDWYNAERLKPDYDPFQTAAELQRRIVSIHPFGDNNGRLSRLLMNWSLENDGQAPSILSEPGNDILVSADDWGYEVLSGCNATMTLLARKDDLERAGVEDPVLLLNLDYEKTFYDQIFTQLPSYAAPDRTTNLDHKAYEKFRVAFDEEFKKFKAIATEQKTVIYYQKAGENYWESEGTPVEYTQGGLVSESYINLVRKGVPLTPMLREAFFNTEMTVYRGALANRDLTDLEICRMFTEYVGMGSSYAALRQSYVPAMSPDTVNRKNAAASLEDYNRLVAEQYRDKYVYHNVREITVDVTKQPLSLSQITFNHAKGRYNHTSPFASFSLSEMESRNWTVSFFLNDQANYSVLYKVSPPQSGSILTYTERNGNLLRRWSEDYATQAFPFTDDIDFPHPLEREVLIPGGLDPNALQSLEVFTRKGGFSAALCKQAHYETVDGRKVIVIDELTGSGIMRRRYRMDGQGGKATVLDENFFPEVKMDLDPVDYEYDDEEEPYDDIEDGYAVHTEDQLEDSPGKNTISESTGKKDSEVENEAPTLINDFLLLTKLDQKDEAALPAYTLSFPNQAPDTLIDSMHSYQKMKKSGFHLSESPSAEWLDKKYNQEKNTTFNV